MVKKALHQGPPIRRTNERFIFVHPPLPPANDKTTSAGVGDQPGWETMFWAEFDDLLHEADAQAALFQAIQQDRPVDRLPLRGLQIRRIIIQFAIHRGGEHGG